MNETQWNDVLLRQGFSGVELCLRDNDDPKYHGLSVIVSSASPTGCADLTTPDMLIISGSDQSLEVQNLSANLIKRLSATGSSISVTRLDQVRASDLESKFCIALTEVDRPILHSIGHSEFEAVKEIVLLSSGTLWVTKGAVIDSQIPEANLFTGLSRTIRAENPGISLSTLDLDPHTSISETTAKNIARLCVAILSPAGTKECEYALRNEIFLINRIFPQQQMNEMLAEQKATAAPDLLPFLQANRPLKLEIGIPGLLDTLRFVDDTEASMPIGEDEVEIKVEASGLNFVDIMISMGQIQDTMLGAECSGYVRRLGTNVKGFNVGDRALTWRLGCHQSYVRNPAAMFHLIPDDMSFVVAASIPIVYCTVYYSLFDAGRLRKGETILIHAASGGVGQAAIILAQYIGAEIFATVGALEKKKLIMDTYGISEDHIFYSRDLNFAKGIMRMTKGRGVDVVLNSLAGEALRETWHCLAFAGRFIELGKKDIVGNTGLDMEPFMRNVTFAAVNLLGIYRNDIPLASRIFADVMTLVHKGIIRAVHPISTYNYSQIETAFRFMQTGKHVGKIVLIPHDDDLVPVSCLLFPHNCMLI